MTYHPSERFLRNPGELSRGIIIRKPHTDSPTFAVETRAPPLRKKKKKKSKSFHRANRTYRSYTGGGRFIYHGFLTVPAFQLLCAVEQRRTNENPPAAAGGNKKEEDGRERKRETEKEGNKKGRKIGDRILLFGRRGHAWFEVCTLSWWCIRTLLKTRGGRIKKKYSFVSAHCLPRFMIVGSVTDEISMPMEARPIFHIEIPPWWCTTRPRNIFFSPYEQMNEPRLSYLQQGPSLEPIQRETICLKTRSAPFPRYICYINSTVCPVLSGIFNCSIPAFFFPFGFLFSFLFFYFDLYVRSKGQRYLSKTDNERAIFQPSFYFISFNLVFTFLSHTHIFICKNLSLKLFVPLLFPRAKYLS